MPYTKLLTSPLPDSICCHGPLMTPKSILMLGCEANYLQIAVLDAEELIKIFTGSVISSTCQNIWYITDKLTKIHSTLYRNQLVNDREVLIQTDA